MISGWTRTENKPGRIDPHQFECPGLQRHRFRHLRKPICPLGRYGHLVQRQRGHVGEQRLQAVNRQSVGRQFGVSFGLGALRDLCRRHQRRAFCPGALTVVIFKQKRRYAMAENRSRISRVLVRVITEFLYSPSDRDDDKFGRRDEPS